MTIPLRGDDRILPAIKGDTDSQFSTGLMYEKGEGTPVDKAKARDYFKKAAAQTEDKDVRQAAKDALRDFF